MVVEAVEPVDPLVFRVQQDCAQEMNHTPQDKTVTSALDAKVDGMIVDVDGVVDATVTRVDVHKVTVIPTVAALCMIPLQVLQEEKVEMVEPVEDISTMVH